MTSRMLGSMVSVGGAACALAVLGPGPAGLPHGPADVPSWLARNPAGESIAALAYLLASAVIAWSSLVLVFAFASRSPGFTGRCAATAATVLTPRAARTALHLAVGVTVGVSATVATASQAAASGARSHPQRSALVPSLDWPVGAPTRSHPSRRTSAVRSGSDVVVRPGDTLWGIAARTLGPQARPGRVARTWPRWYSANRRVIGSDPDLIRPGQRLRPPHDLHGGTP